jgi:2-polyprenyl-3-methyl-5-hydroxy-6-metoxy-1,4-benzoquinol methylase
MGSSDVLPHCVACMSDSTAVFYRNPKRTISVCKNCGLYFVVPKQSVPACGSGFEEGYFSANQTSGATRLDLEFESWRRPALKRIVRAIKRYREGGCLLDVGCAGGVLFDYFESDKWTLCGVEPSKYASEHACERVKGRSNITIVNSYLGDVGLTAETFDIITVLESLYHMPNPQKEMKEIARLLKPDGRLFIEIPNWHYQRFWRTGPINYLLKKEWCSLTYTHITYFTEHSLAALGRQVDMKISERIPMFGSVYGSFVQRFLQRVYFELCKTLSVITHYRVNMSPRTLYVFTKYARE